jgi:hypothetical protein
VPSSPSAFELFTHFDTSYICNMSSAAGFTAPPHPARRRAPPARPLALEHFSFQDYDE